MPQLSEGQEDEETPSAGEQGQTGDRRTQDTSCPAIRCVPCPHGNRTREITATVALFERIAAEEGWQPGEALTRYIGESTYLVAYPAGAPEEIEPLGGLQLVLPDTMSALPTLAVWPELAPEILVRPGNVAHILVLAIDKPARGAGVFWPLCAALWRHCVDEQIHELWLEATPPTLKVYQRLGWPLTVRGALRTHWGEDCYPCSMTVREVAGALLEKAVRSPAYRRIIDLACQAPPANV
jgi:hypothetical protein